MTGSPSRRSRVSSSRVTPSQPFPRFERAAVEQSVASRFEQQVERYADRLAVKTPRQALSFAALNRTANRIARAVAETAPPGDRPVALLLGHDAGYVAAILGVLKAGRCYVPLDPAIPEARLKFILDDAQACLIVTDRTHRDAVAGLSKGTPAVLDIDGLDSAIADDNLGLSVAPDAIANITYTSGSTGEPKGVVQTQRGLLHAALRRINNQHISPDDRSVLLFPFSFSAARQVTFSALLNGAALLPFDVKAEGLVALESWLRDEEVTVLDWLPTGFRHFVASLSGQERFPKLRLIAMSSEQLSAADVELYRRHFSRGCLMVNMLASTEAGPIRMYFLDHETQLEGNGVPAGYPVEDMEILLLDAAEDLARGVVGEIAVKSRYFAVGYWRKPELSAAAFDPAPDGDGRRILRTGDLGRFRPDGCLEGVGRKDSMVQIRGFRVEPTEVEMALLELTSIREAAVVAREDRTGELQLVAYVVPTAQPGPQPGALREQLQAKLPIYMIPAAFVPLDRLPLTPTGKLDRRALPAPDPAVPDGTRLAPRDATEEHLARIWQELLAVQEVGVRDDFFALGGHSLLAARLFARIEQTFGQQLPLSVLLEGPTIEQLARLLSDSRTAALPSLVAIQPAGTRPPFFCVHPLLGDVLLYRSLARSLGPDQPFYGLRPPRSNGEATRPAFASIEAMAAQYIQEIQTVQPDGPYLLGGYSLGGVIAFEMAQQLRARNQQVSLLLVIDSALPADRPRMPQSSADKIAKLIPQLARLWQLPAYQAELGVQHHRLLVSYRPRPYPGPIVYLRSQEAFPLSLLGPQEVDVAELWAGLALGGLDLRPVPGNHVSMFQEPHLGVLAGELKRCLEAAATDEVRALSS